MDVDTTARSKSIIESGIPVDRGRRNRDGAGIDIDAAALLSRVSVDRGRPHRDCAGIDIDTAA
jgi:hypothetical protein